MTASILIDGDAFTLLAGQTPIGERRRLAGEALTRLQAINRRYALLERRPDPDAAVAIGRELYRWLDGDQQQLQRLLEQAARPLLLSVHCPARDPSPAAWVLLQAPWELLADARGPLAADALLQFSPLRRLGPMGQPPPLDDHRLGLAFMAAAPEGVAELDYEAEEAAILDAVGNTRLDLLVDESGAAEPLGRRLAEIAAAHAHLLALS